MKTERRAMPKPSLLTQKRQAAIPCSQGYGTRRAFTLIELLVVFIIISILSSLMLAGLAGARQRAKTDKTKSTIRKIDSVIRPMFDSYRTRRVALTSPSLTNRKSNALSLLIAKRSLMVREMPDSWDDVPDVPADPQAFNNLADSGGTDLRTAPVRAYTITRIANSSNPNYSLSLLKNYGSSECLFMIVTRSGFEPDALEMFRTDEVGDIDKDGANEFLDGWGRPIAFLRWAPGMTGSLVQNGNPDLAHDPMDPLRQDSTAFALVPLIFSAGPDESTNAPDDSAADGYGLARVASWSAQDLSKICDVINADNQKPGVPKVGNTSAYQDNITNHDLLKK
ncbi:MAG: type II secretion system protein [Planctomycetota bacterium]|nr:MAG: type II secretion system protein [Planctomycetota bacterium]